MNGQRYAFILRVWAEGDANPSQPAWRGSLEAVDGEALRYFDSIPRLIALLTAATGWQDNPQSLENISRSKP